MLISLAAAARRGGRVLRLLLGTMRVFDYVRCETCVKMETFVIDPIYYILLFLWISGNTLIAVTSLLLLCFHIIN